MPMVIMTARTVETLMVVVTSKGQRKSNFSNPFESGATVAV